MPAVTLKLRHAATPTPSVMMKTAAQSMPVFPIHVCTPQPRAVVVQRMRTAEIRMPVPPIPVLMEPVFSSQSTTAATGQETVMMEISALLISASEESVKT
jgi:hypothetical protein